MRYFQSIAFAAALTFPAMAQEAADAVAPEAETGVTHAFAGLSKAGHAALEAKANGMPTEAQEWMVAAANPLAVEAGGAAILRQGGTAADAMVAVQAVLGGLVEPQSSAWAAEPSWSGMMRPAAS